MGAAASTLPNDLPDFVDATLASSLLGDAFDSARFLEEAENNTISRERFLEVVAAVTKTTSKFRVLHFNDVYNIGPQAREPVGGAPRFVHKMKRIVSESELPTLVVFGGDAFNPSLMSTVTKGKHMLPILKNAGVTVACIGNHDLDFGIENLKNLIKECDFPWLISNVKFKPTGRNLAEGLSKFIVEVGEGRRVGFIGLVESEWMQTLSTVNEDDIIYEDFCECGRRLASELRTVDKVDCVIAITHMRVPNDEKLAKECGECIDLICAGHDHHYDVKPVGPDNIYLCKSGTDFRDITNLVVEFGENQRGVVVGTPEHIVIDSSVEEDDATLKLVEEFEATLGGSMEKSIGSTLVELDARFESIRTKETNIGNFIADVLRRGTSADVAIINSGTLRADCIFQPGTLSMKDLVALLPMLDETAVIEMNSEQLLNALENGVSQYPRLEGRFPQVSGVSFEFSAEKSPGSRITQGSVKVGEEEVVAGDGKVFRVATKAYLTKGKDGYDIMADCKVLMDEEDCPVLPTLLINTFTELDVLNKLTKFKHPVLRMAQKWRSTTHCENDAHDAEKPIDYRTNAKFAIKPKVEGRIRNMDENK